MQMERWSFPLILKRKMQNTGDDIPATAKWVADFIQRIGFPIFMALALLVMYIWDHSKVQDQAKINTDHLTFAIEKNTEAVAALRHFLTHKYDD